MRTIGLSFALTLFAFAGAVRAQPLSREPSAETLLLGDGWGCARVVAEVGRGWQCWRAPLSSASARTDRPPATVPAWRVPWMESANLVAGPDRLCALAAPADREIRCWLPPARDDTEPRPWPGSTAGPRPPLLESIAYYNADALYPDWVGGTFACVARGMSAVWCVGDNSFGQLGFDDGAAGAPLLPIQRVTNIGLGTWHACLTHQDYRDAGILTCWGRGDAGQLGFAPTDRCRVGDGEIACARKPTPVSLNLELDGLVYAPNRGPSALRAGDLFTCIHQSTGIYCWGASRDGFFGSQTACPPGLAGAWPTLSGARVAAPHAACSTVPVRVAGTDRFKHDSFPRTMASPRVATTATDNFDVGPRGLCEASDEGQVWCRGGVPIPRRLPPASGVKVSAGGDASACAILRTGAVLCWGEGYALAGDRGRPLRIALSLLPEPPKNPNQFFIDRGRNPTDRRPWGPMCLARRGCPESAITIPPCAASVQARPWAEVRVAGGLEDGQRITVSGPLNLGTWYMRGVGCPDTDPLTHRSLAYVRCCREGGTTAVLGPAGHQDEKEQLLLPAFGCEGDTSRWCCNIAPKGQMVVVTGTLHPNRQHDRPDDWQLDDVEFCQPPPPPPPP